MSAMILLDSADMINRRGQDSRRVEIDGGDVGNEMLDVRRQSREDSD